MAIPIKYWKIAKFYMDWYHYVARGICKSQSSSLFKNKILYNLIGELNEIIAHELRHQHQRDTGLFDLDNTTSNEEEDGFIQYSKPEEIDAQVDGFKRMRDVTKRPFEELVRNWFRTHQTIHSMNPEDTKKVIDLILDYYRNS